jgi:hypothetical protein
MDQVDSAGRRPSPVIEPVPEIFVLTRSQLGSDERAHQTSGDIEDLQPR